MIERALSAGPGMVARVRFTDRADGDFRVDGPLDPLTSARAAIVAHPWTWLRQVHGATVIVVEAPGEGAGVAADASLTVVPGAVLSVQAADCAPVVMVAGEYIAIAHAGWRGIVEGVLAATVAEVRRRTDDPIRALLGPCIHAAGYEFGEAELDRVVGVAGPNARGQTHDGRPALDLPATVDAVLADIGVGSFDDIGLDTADPRFYSHRTRGDRGRQVSAVWLEPC